ncbi:type I-C CRISPR-associated protein Cas5c [Phytomonospora sp. NPDC050363]|uniref:type I-C CRISPR-associated protein Cas5c n=1 Tax=Phytomonospora sp. NPDC050363 TaxID=3155642 RepID=UPI0033D57D73
MNRHDFLARLPRDAERNLPVAVQVSGPGALFSRPEFKAERLTYPVMPPSAAKGVLEAIFWKPEMRYQIAAIEVLAPIRQFTVRRNETHDVAPLREAAKGIRRIDTAATRDQRNAVCLRDVAYRIHALIHTQPHATKPVTAYRDQFQRRVKRGACFQQPYLGAKEFSADFGPIDADIAPINRSEDLGIMPHTVAYDGTTHSWFTAVLDRGVLWIPAQGIPVPAGVV